MVPLSLASGLRPLTSDACTRSTLVMSDFRRKSSPPPPPPIFSAHRCYDAPGCNALGTALLASSTIRVGSDRCGGGGLARVASFRRQRDVGAHNR